MTRHLLGASVTGDWRTGDRILDLRVTPGGLSSCRGTVPIGPDAVAEIAWRRDGDAIDYTLHCDREQMIMTSAGPRTLDAGDTSLRLRSSDGRHFGLSGGGRS